MNYLKASKAELKKELEIQRKRFDDYKAMGLSYNMTRGKPDSAQLALSDEMLDPKYIGDGKAGETNCKNYGGIDGIEPMKKLFAELMNTNPENIIVGNNSSLNMMYDLLMKFMIFGTPAVKKPWCKSEKLKFICPVPGYDRHFLVTESLGFDLISVPILADGPDMDMIEKLVAEDEFIKGMWSVPKYSNPTGVVYSDEVVDRLGRMYTKAEDFTIFCDDAYSVHFFGDEPAKQKSLMKACEEGGHPDRCYTFMSTSKMTFPGDGVAAMGSSLANIEVVKKWISVQSIGPDKMNQLRHANFLKDYEHVIEHMRKHAKLLKPKFDVFLETFEEEMGDTGIFTWSKPEGGYFISVDTLPGLAKKTVAKCNECGVAFTPAGSTYPYKIDPQDRNIRIAPSFPPYSQLKDAATILCICVKICTLEQLLGI